MEYSWPTRTCRRGFQGCPISSRVSPASTASSRRTRSVPMKMLGLVSALLGALLARASFGHADSLRYWGQGPREATGVIELGKNHYSTIEVGADIPGWGRVKAVGDAYLVVEHALTPAQRDELSKR